MAKAKKVWTVRGKVLSPEEEKAAFFPLDETAMSPATQALGEKARDLYEQFKAARDAHFEAVKAEYAPAVPADLVMHVFRSNYGELRAIYADKATKTTTRRGAVAPPPAAPAPAKPPRK